MIIAHSTGEEVSVLRTSTIILSYLVNYVDNIHFVTSEINGTPSSSSLKNDHKPVAFCTFAISCPSPLTNLALKWHAGSWYALTQRSVPTPPVNSTILELSSDT